MLLLLEIEKHYYTRYCVVKFQKIMRLYVENRARPQREDKSRANIDLPPRS